MWLYLTLFSALFLGIYDLIRKHMLNNNAVIPVLFFASLTSLIIFVPIFILSNVSPEFMQKVLLYVPQISFHTHFLLFIKSIIVVTSWTLAYFAIRHLPITIVSPIRATAPFWVLIGAVTLFSEKLNRMQWIGVIVTIASFYGFSIAGKLEGISFRKNKWIWCIIGATITGAISALYDKYLLLSIDRMAVQAWFTFYQVILLIPLILLIWYPIRKKFPFTWKWGIPLISGCLLISDFLYFYALSCSDSLVSIISPIRRSGVVIAFFMGGILFKEVNIKRKAIYLFGILAGIFLIMLGS